MVHFLISLILSGGLLVASGISEIQSVNSLTPIYEEIEISGEGTLVLLDVGKTLLQPTDPLFHEPHEAWKKEWFAQYNPELSPQESAQRAQIVEEFLVMDDMSWELLEQWPDLVKRAQLHKMKVVAFSKVMIDPTLKHGLPMRLAYFGIPIQDEFPELSNQGSQFVYANGVIQTGEKLKGPVLKEVLSLISHRPSQIIFVDDRKAQLESVQQTCQELGIPVVCFHYARLTESPPFDEAVASYQLNMLVKEHRWISSHEASEILKSQP